jgi:glyoxylase I family protein
MPPTDLAAPATPSLRRIHHAAVICADYARSRHFYTAVLGLRVVAEHHRAERQSHKLDLALADGGQVELFSFPAPPPRPSRPEAQGLRHLALAVDDIDAWLAHLARHGVATEAVRVDEFTGARFVFFADPDGLPIELVEQTPADAEQALRTLELRRIAALLAADMATLATLHAPDYQLLSPSGRSFDRVRYLGLIGDGTLRYLQWAPQAIAVRASAAMAVVRYRVSLQLGTAEAPGSVQPCWHTDTWERGPDGWQAVWSQATRIADPD